MAFTPERSLARRDELCSAWCCSRPVLFSLRFRTFGLQRLVTYKHRQKSAPQGSHMRLNAFLRCSLLVVVSAAIAGHYAPVAGRPQLKTRDYKDMFDKTEVMI